MGFDDAFLAELRQYSSVVLVVVLGKSSGRGEREKEKVGGAAG